MRTFLTCLFSCLQFLVLAQNNRIQEMPHWVGYLQMNDRLTIPFDFYFDNTKTKRGLSIRNGKEWIYLKTKTKKDSLVAFFKEFDAKLIFKLKQDDGARGYWINYNKTKPIRIPFTAQKLAIPKFECSNSQEDTLKLSMKYKVDFEKSKTTSIGKFYYDDQEIHGTFRTETGDYRFLSGCATGQTIRLSSFNGNWAMLLEAQVHGDTIRGHLYSGTTYSTFFEGVADKDFALKNPDELTKVINEQSFAFSEIVNLRNRKYRASKYQNKVVLYQIMGTWCPNCIDEAKCYKALFEKYNKSGLEIHGLAYEIERPNVKTTLRALRRFKKRMGLNYPIFYAGKASKEIASKQFPMLNQISSFPTSILVGKTGKIEYIHTGFNGPATGDVYYEFIEHLEAKIEQLLEE